MGMSLTQEQSETVEKINESKYNRLWVLQLVLRGDVANFVESAIKAEALKSDYDVGQAEEYLEKIEDSIARYKNGRPQKFSEVKK